MTIMSIVYLEFELWCISILHLLIQLGECVQAKVLRLNLELDWIQSSKAFTPGATLRKNTFRKFGGQICGTWRRDSTFR